MRGDSGLQPMSDQGWWACLPPGFRAAEKIQEQNTPLTLHRPLKQQPVPCLSLLWRPASDLPLPPPPATAKQLPPAARPLVLVTR